MRVEQRSEQRLPAVKMQPPQSFTRKAGELTSPSHEHLVSFLYGKKRHVPRVVLELRCKSVRFNRLIVMFYCSSDAGYVTRAASSFSRRRNLVNDDCGSEKQKSDPLVFLIFRSFIFAFGAF